MKKKTVLTFGVIAGLSSSLLLSQLAVYAQEVTSTQPEVNVTANPEVKVENKTTTTEVSSDTTESEKKVEKVETTESGTSAFRSVVSQTVTGQDLTTYIGTLSDNSLSTKELTNQEVIHELLLWAAPKAELLGAQADDYISFANSLGMTNGVELSSLSTPTDVANLYTTAKQLYDAYRAEKKQPLFINGKAQPIFPYTSGAVENPDNYSYETSDIVRYTVYVETDYDTDGDGKRDLVKALVQLPKAAAEGDYKAATIFEARPYITGTTEKMTLAELGLTQGGEYDIKKMYTQPEARKSTGVSTTVETAKKAKSSDWYYYNPAESAYDYEDLNWYDYFLARGFAVVESAGLGSKGSEGFQAVGSDLEINAFKNIVEWLNGKRVAYTDKTSNIQIAADWSNGSVGMSGISWAGTMPFGVATTGVEGLKTIVPAAGIASWYDYFLSQGVPFNHDAGKFLSWLSIYTAGRTLDVNDTNWNMLKDEYAKYVTQLNKEQDEHGNNYSDFWKNRDYTIHAENIKASALLVQGLNDFNVKSKHVELMHQAFEKAGQNVKLFLHQGEHTFPTKVANNYGIPVGNTNFFEIMNEWLSHYLYGLTNNAENMPAVMAQDSADPSKWRTFDSWHTNNTLTLTAKSANKESTISSNHWAYGIGTETNGKDELVSKKSTGYNATYMTEIKEDTLIKGSIPVTFKASLKSGEGNDYPISVMLVDVAEEEFQAVRHQGSDLGAHFSDANGDYNLIKKDGFWMGSNVPNVDLKDYKAKNTKFNVIARGWTNLTNPESLYTSASATNSIDVKIGENHDYTVYLHPTVYNVKKGHKLALVIAAFDTNLGTYDYNKGTYLYSYPPYEITIDTASIKAVIPTETEATELVATHVTDTVLLKENATAYVKVDTELTDDTIIAQINKDSVPLGTIFTVKTKPTTNTLGNFIATVTVTTPDGTVTEIEVPVIVYTATTGEPAIEPAKPDFNGGVNPGTAPIEPAKPELVIPKTDTTVSTKQEQQLPHTGTTKAAIFNSVGALFLGMGLFFTKKKRK